MIVIFVVALIICIVQWIVWKAVALLCIELLKEHGYPTLSEDELDERMGAAVLRAITEFRLCWKGFQ